MINPLTSSVLGKYSFLHPLYLQKWTDIMNKFNYTRLCYIVFIIWHYMTLRAHFGMKRQYLRNTSAPAVNCCLIFHCLKAPGRVAQSVTCLATDACLTADPGVASSIPVRSHTFVEIDHEMISMVILLPSADSFMKGCCQLQAKVCARITG